MRFPPATRRRWTGHLRECWRQFRLARMRPGTSTGSCPWTPRSHALISMRRGPYKGAAPAESAHDHALGRSRGGLTTKVHLACDGLGRPLDFVVTGGNVNDFTRLEQVLAQIKVRRPGPGRPRSRPDHLLGDKGYSSRHIRDYLRKRGIPHTIPERADQQANRRRRGTTAAGHPPFDRPGTSNATWSNVASTH